MADLYAKMAGAEALEKDAGMFGRAGAWLYNTAAGAARGVQGVVNPALHAGAAHAPAPAARAPAARAPTPHAPAAGRAPAAPAAPHAPAAPAGERTWVQHADEALTEARNAPMNAWNQMSPDNQQFLANGAGAVGRFVRRGAMLGAVGAGLYGGYRVLNDGSANEQDARMRDYLASTQHQMQAPLPGMSVYASYDEFAAAKHAELLAKEANTIFVPPPTPYNTGAQGAMAAEFGKALASKLVTAPIDTVHGFLKRKFIDEPKHERVFRQVIDEDPMLREAYAANPTAMERSFAAMRKMSPDVAELHGPVTSFLRHATMSGGTLDLAAVRQLAETQRFYQQGKNGDPR